ncbi:endopeptidase La [Rickettsiales bacterium]|nr:endopeptidase La [Rickettsiales bacterium]
MIDYKDNKQKIKGKNEFYSLPLRDLVMFPDTTATILVGRKGSINSINAAQSQELPIMAVAQIDPEKNDFIEENIHKTGTLCKIIESIRTIDGNLKLVIKGIKIVKITNIISDKKIFICQAQEVKKKKQPKTKEFSVLVKECLKGFAKYSQYNKRITPDVVKSVSTLKSSDEIINIILAFLSSKTYVKQSILEETNPHDKVLKLYEALQFELNILNTEAQIAQNIQKKINKSQKDLYLNEQLKYIQKELSGGEESEAEELKKQLAKLKLPTEVAKKCSKEIERFEKTNPMSSEAGVVRNYIDLILSLPWTKKSKNNENLEKAQQILDKDHYGLEKIKERILELVAVQIKTKSVKGPIMCFVGPPGVGKTSLAKSIAASLSRKYAKVSLGGVKDESEIRGHRRTYIGSLPGRIISSMKKAKTINPLMLLDEIDKMAHDIKGDPSSAMLEVLDPEQNNAFNDHYLEIDYDLSKVMFIATANNITNIPTPLRDRMEIIKLSGYSESEKLQIAKLYLIPKQRKESGLSAKEFKINDDAILKLIRNYTFEAGVRNLEREIAKIARKIAKKIILKQVKTVSVNIDNIKTFSGIEKCDHGIKKENNLVGVSTGLAYTEFGGDLLDIEALKFNGKGKIQTTGKLGEVMSESAKISLSHIRSIAKKLKISESEYNEYDFHIHFPEGATPKDGPSAGVAICLALASCITSMPVDKNVAVTGEVTLNGLVLPIGGLKEKLLAALRGKIKKVLIPKKNEKDLEDMPIELLENIEIKSISNIEEAFQEALVGYNDDENRLSSKNSSIDQYEEKIVIESEVIT